MEPINLYQKDSKDKVRLWQIRVEQDSITGTATIVTATGLLGGALVETRVPVQFGKNVGRANETTAYEQAISEAESKSRLKMKEGYVANFDELKEAQTMGSGWKEPMLAQKFHPTGAQSSSKTLDQLKLRGKLIATQRKKDGNRAYIRITPVAGGLPKVEIRNRKTEPYLYGFPTLVKQLEDNYLNTFGTYGPELTLDGEFYTCAVSFNKLNGVLKAKTLKPGYEAILESCNYHLFDLVDAKGYAARHVILQNFESPLVHVEAYDVIEATEENLLERLRQYQSEGEEGLMIRTLDAPYQHKRTWDLMKYKDDQTEDYKIIGMEEHAVGGMVGAVVFEAPPFLKDRDGRRIESFKAGTTNLSHEESREMWQDYQLDLRCTGAHAKETKYVGKIGTVRFFEYSEYLIPRFPKFVGVRADA